MPNNPARSHSFFIVCQAAKQGMIHKKQNGKIWHMCSWGCLWKYKSTLYLWCNTSNQQQHRRLNQVSTTFFDYSQLWKHRPRLNQLPRLAFRVHIIYASLRTHIHLLHQSSLAKYSRVSKLRQQSQPTTLKTETQVHLADNASNHSSSNKRRSLGSPKRSRWWVISSMKSRKHWLTITKAFGGDKMAWQGGWCVVM